jgi:hypothetical protein
MTDQPDANHPQLNRDELLALKFAAHRQLSRWARSRPLGARTQARRDALLSAVRTLDDARIARAERGLAVGRPRTVQTGCVEATLPASTLGNREPSQQPAPPLRPPPGE